MQLPLGQAGVERAGSPTTYAPLLSDPGAKRIRLTGVRTISVAPWTQEGLYLHSGGAICIPLRGRDPKEQVHLQISH